MNRIIAAALVYALPAVGLSTDVVSFNHDVRPILSEHCFECHGPDSNQREADLRLDVREAAIESAIVPGDQESELILRICAEDPEVRMPPPEFKKQLTSAQVDVLRRWIEQGAVYEKHWSLMPIKRPEVPGDASNPIDAFISRRLKQAGLTTSPAADRQTLLRRVTFDLTGLPPTPQEMKTFLDDRSALAYERVVDRLLASKHYGEHMALPWLEAARYADTSGYQADWERFMWPWRNWVIDSFNSNMPFDQFTIEQLAGDMLPNATQEQILATGFNRNHRINDEGGVIAAEYAVEYVVDRVDTTSTVWLGLTMGCCRCHDHKYDPLSQQDFYNMFALFNNVPEKGKDGRKGYSLPALDYPNPAVSMELKKLTESLDQIEVELQKTASAATRDRRTELREKIETAKAKQFVKVMVMGEMESPRATFVLNRGEYDQPNMDRPARPNIPEVFGDLSDRYERNRLGFAKWLVSKENPLTARVAVNRFWQSCFGRGLVPTVEDFGSQGVPPTHPELLDWLASEFRDSGWDVKALHKQLVMSHVYRQSSIVTLQHLQLDPENKWLARAPRLRLSGYQLRDQALAAGGLLVRELGGPSVKPYQPPGLWSEFSFQDKKRSTDFYVQDHGEKLYRRGLYTFWKRSVAPPMLANFDAAGREMCTVRLTRTSTPMQALNLMNDVTFVESARAIGQRMILEGGAKVESRVHFAFALFGASPRDETVRQLVGSYAEYHEYFAANSDVLNAFLSNGEWQHDAALDKVDLATCAALASVIMNLDEVIVRQ